MKFETTYYVETVLETEKIIERHDNEKMILRFIVCANYYHDLICVKSECKINQFINVVNIVLLGDLTAEQKAQELSDHCRINYKDFVKLDFHLKFLANQVKKKYKKQKMVTSETSKEKL